VGGGGESKSGVGASNAQRKHSQSWGCRRCFNAQVCQQWVLGGAVWGQVVPSVTHIFCPSSWGPFRACMHAVTPDLPLHTCLLDVQAAVRLSPAAKQQLEMS
jgi:hypothetical protein